MSDKRSGTDAAPEKTVKRSKLGQRILWIAGPLLVLGVGGYFYAMSGRYVSTDDAYVSADQVTVAPQVAGRVVEVDVRENQPVHKGDILFRIDARPMQLAAEQLHAEMLSVADYLSAAKDSYQGALANLQSAKAQVAHDKALYQRRKNLHAKGLLDQQSLDDAANDLAVARAGVQAAQAAVSKARTQLGGNVDTPVQHLSAYKMIKAQLAKAELDLEHATVRAPTDGVIGKNSLQPGDFLQVGQAAMPLIATRMWVDADFKETDLTNVKAGQPTRIVLDTYPGYTWKARVESIGPASGAVYSVLPAQNATGNWVKVVQRIPVRLEFMQRNEDAPVIRAGMSAQVRIDTGADNQRWKHWPWLGGESARAGETGRRRN